MDLIKSKRYTLIINTAKKTFKANSSLRNLGIKVHPNLSFATLASYRLLSFAPIHKTLRRQLNKFTTKCNSHSVVHHEIQRCNSFHNNGNKAYYHRQFWSLLHLTQSTTTPVTIRFCRFSFIDTVTKLSQNGALMNECLILYMSGRRWLCPLLAFSLRLSA